MPSSGNTKWWLKAASGEPRTTAITRWLREHRTRTLAFGFQVHQGDDEGRILYALLTRLRNHYGWRDPPPLEPAALREGLPTWLARAAAEGGMAFAVDGIDVLAESNALVPAYLPPGVHWLVACAQVAPAGWRRWVGDRRNAGGDHDDPDATRCWQDVRSPASRDGPMPSRPEALVRWLQQDPYGAYRKVRVTGLPRQFPDGTLGPRIDTRQWLEIARFARYAGHRDLENYLARASDAATSRADRAAIAIEHAAWLQTVDRLDEAEAVLSQTPAEPLVGNVDTELKLLHQRAELAEARGRYDDAETFYRKALERAREHYGKIAVAVLPYMANLIALQRAGHRFESAEALCRHALEIAGAHWPAFHPKIIALTDQLGALRYAASDYGEARELYERAVHSAEIAFGPEHPAMAATLSNLATTLDAQRAYRAAEQAHRRALRIRDTVLGPAHADTLTSVHNLAAALEAVGHKEEAETLYRRAVESWQSTVGADHPAAATSMNNLAELLRERGAWEEAEALYRHTIETWRRLFGETHPNTIVAIIELGSLYAEKGQDDWAEAMLRHGLTASAQAMGTASAAHIRATCQLAHVLKRQNLREEARDLVFELWRTVDGTPDALSARMLPVRHLMDALADQE